MSQTTTVRLPAELRTRLERAAHQLARRKSWIIARALDDYLARMRPADALREARRQCRLANRGDRRERGWEQFADFSAK